MDKHTETSYAWEIIIFLWNLNNGNLLIFRLSEFWEMFYFFRKKVTIYVHNELVSSVLICLRQ
jgi:hypothetical protein